ncbi:AraC family transcriptional regulator [Actinoplanes sp. NPDC051411]|uniref:AraC family transcriptional regulator n=1 Tax=Actinoplanes sp. NPDC051411 TaxID=3155522 RepID=UPI003444B633
MSVQTDPLEDVLTLVGTTSRMSTSMIAGGEWALAFDAPPPVKFNALRRGRCLLRIGGTERWLDEGDCFLLTRAESFVLASGPDVPPVPAGPVFARAVDGVAHAGEGDDLYMIGGRFGLGDRAHELLLNGLPPVVHVPAGTPEAATIDWTLGRIDTELRERPLASTLVTEHLALVMLIQVLRAHLSRDGAATGWLAGLGDPVVAPALRALHSRPAQAWTVADLAAEAAVSRSTLAARFKQAVGQSPLDYLTGWRIELAADRLRRGDQTLAAIARAVGYGSESALSNAFKRITGRSPRAWQRAPASRA